ncbi:MAG: branched-chain amino acid transaminase [Candidatus Hodarchaeota archaeon]
MCGAVIDEEFAKTAYIWMDGSFVPWHEAKVHVFAHALHYATAIFEGLRFYESGSQDGNVYIFRLEDHIKRFFYGVKVYFIEIPFTPQQIMDAIVDLIAKNNLHTTGYIRPIAFLGYGKFGLNPVGLPVHTAIIVLPFGRYLGEKAIKEGIHCCISAWERISPRALPTTVKCTANYANSVLARWDAIKNGFDEAIFLDHRGFVCEGSGENIFCIRYVDGKTEIDTPPIYASNLEGITRNTIMTLIEKELGLKAEETDITPGELYGYDEIFLTGTAGEVTPVTRINHRTIGNGKPGKITLQLQNTYFRIVSGKVEKYKHWLTPVY